MTLGELISAYRKKNKMSMEEFANKSGMSKGYVSMLEKNINPSNQKPITPSISMIQKAAKGMDSTFDVIFSQLNPDIKVTLDDGADKSDYSNIKNVIPLPKAKEIPIIGGIACGTPILAEQNIDGQVKIPEFVQADFALRCNGDSMIGAHIRDGDLVCIRIQPDVDDGQIAAVLIGEDATLKRVYHRPDGVMLVAENPSFAPMVYIGEECEDIRILGKAMTCISKVR